MQVILRKNYIHLVMVREDLDRFRTQHEVVESVIFGDSFGDKFLYSVRTNHSYEKLQVRLIANELQVCLPKPLAHEWLYTDLADFERSLDVGEGRELFLKVSKDPLTMAEAFLTEKDNSTNHPPVETS